MKKISFGQTSISLFEIDKPGGNKFYKLKFNLIAAKEAGVDTLLSFGGAWSNHLHAMAELGADEGFQTIGIVRGERPRKLSAMLEDVQKLGMRLVFVSRQRYQQKETPEFNTWLKKQFGDYYLLPEGGTNDLAVRGCSEILSSFKTVPYDLVCLPVGTGGTLAGIAKALGPHKSVLGFSVLKGAKSLEKKVASLLSCGANSCGANKTLRKNWSINHEFHCGGYAKCPSYLKEFILRIEEENDIRLDPVYTGKMLYGIFQLLERGDLGCLTKSSDQRSNKRHDKNLALLAIHTGGLQGRRGYGF